MPETVRFDHYEVLTRDDGSLYELGRGAMGVTYKALDTNLRIPVCLKVIAANHLHSDIARQRFIREARSAARLRNPNVAAVYHLGLEGDTWFYAMEFIDGETVDALIKRNGPLPPKLALEIADQVAKAYGAAEPHGLVHRDIKPANLMVIRDGEQVLVKVIDFGLAKSSLPDDESATLSMGGFVGTPHFASPEQLEERDLDVRSDIYSLGVTLWFMLAGRTPFAGSMAQVMSQHLSKTPPFEKLKVPAPMARLLRKLLEKNALDRPQNSVELRKDIARCIVELDSPDAIAEPSEAVSPSDAEENYMTMVDPGLLAAGTVTFEIGQLVAARYRVVESLGDSNLGRVYRAQDQTRAHDVRLVVLHESISLSTEAMSALERMIELLIPRPHPNLQRIEAIETVEGASFLVLEWCEGATLLDLLRARRELDSGEVIALLTQAAAGLDHVTACGVEETELALHRVFVSFARKPEIDWLREGMGHWPDFTVKINPLSRRGAEAAGETWAGGQTMVDAPRPSAGGASEKAVRSLAAIAYELLGGKLSATGLALGTFDFKPVAALGEAGNEVLRRALSTEPPFPSAGEFIKALTTPENIEFARRDHYGTASPTRAAASRGGETVAAPVALAPAPAPAKKSPILAVAIGAALLAGGGAVWYLKRPVPVAPPVNPGTTESGTSSTGTTTTTIPETTTEPEKKTPAPPTEKELLEKAVADAKALELREAWGACLAAWVKVARDFPNSNAGKANLEIVCGTLRLRPYGLGPEVFEPMKEPLAAAADMGIISAMMVLGENLKLTEPETALKWYLLAGEKGDPEGLTQAALLQSNGWNGHPADLEASAKLLEQAVEKGHVSAKLLLGESYLYGKGVTYDYKKAVSLIREAADASNAKALDLLGTLYSRPKSLPPSFNEFPADLTEAAKLYQKAAEAGNAGSWYNLAVLQLKNGGGEGKALLYARRGSEAKDPNSMFMLATFTEAGLSPVLPKNVDEAKRLYVEAAELGQPRAQDWCRKNNVEFTAKPVRR